MGATASRRSRRRSAHRSRGRESRNTATWLGTAGTVVAIATGLFTLRGDVFPAATGRPASQRLSAFVVKVGSVCRALNAADGALRRGDEVLHRKLDAAASTLEQRNLLYDAATDSLNRSYTQLLNLEAAVDSAVLDATDVADVQAALRTWRRNIARMSVYQGALDRASSRPRLEAVLRGLPRVRRELGSGAQRLRDALLRLGHGQCWFSDPLPLRSFTLPPIRDLSDTPSSRTGSGSGKHGPGRGGAGRSNSEPLTPIINTPSPQRVDCVATGSNAFTREARRGARRAPEAPTKPEGIIEAPRCRHAHGAMLCRGERGAHVPRSPC